MSPQNQQKPFWVFLKKWRSKKPVKLKKILDGKGLVCRFQQDLYKPKLQRHYWLFGLLYKYVLFPQRMPEISVEKVNNKWYYSSETVSKIDEIYKEVYPWYVEEVTRNNVPASGHKKIFAYRTLAMGWGTCSCLIVGYVLFLIAKKIAFLILKKIQHQITQKTNLELNKVLLKLAHPLSLLLVFSFFDKIFASFQFGLEINTWVFKVINIAIVVFWIYVFLKIVQVVMEIYQDIYGRNPWEVGRSIGAHIEQLFSQGWSWLLEFSDCWP